MEGERKGENTNMNTNMNKHSVGLEIKTKLQEHRSTLHMRNNLMKFQSWPQGELQISSESQGVHVLEIFKEKVHGHLLGVL